MTDIVSVAVLLNTICALIAGYLLRRIGRSVFSSAWGACLLWLNAWGLWLGSFIIFSAIYHRLASSSSREETIAVVTSIMLADGYGLLIAVVAMWGWVAS